MATRVFTKDALKQRAFKVGSILLVLSRESGNDPVYTIPCSFLQGNFQVLSISHSLPTALIPRYLQSPTQCSMDNQVLQQILYHHGYLK